MLQYQLKDRLGDQRGGSEWEPIKILLGRNRNSNKMNSVGHPKSHALHSTFRLQNHVATEVLLVLGTNTTSSLNSYMHTAAETTQESAVWRGGGQTGYGGRLDRLHLVTEKSSETPLPSTKTPHSFTSRNL
jgi:hypothetical protein